MVATSTLVTRSPAVAFHRLTLCVTGGRPARMHSQQWAPTGASWRHSVQAGRPHLVQDRPVSRSRWWKQYFVSMGGRYGSAAVTLASGAYGVSAARTRSTCSATTDHMTHRPIFRPVMRPASASTLVWWLTVG